MFYYNFLKLCNKKGISPSAAAEQMGYQRSVATRWKSGISPRQATLQKVADYFGVSVEYLKGAEQKEKTATENGSGMDAVTKEIFDEINSMSKEEKQTFLDFVRVFKNR